MNYLIELKQRKEPATGVAPVFVYPMGTSMRKRHNVICAMRTFRTMHYNRTLRCTVTEENGTAQLFQRFAYLNCHTGFVMRSDVFVHGNDQMNVSGDNSDLKKVEMCGH